MKPVYLALAVHVQIALHLATKRLKAACRTNEPQATAVIAMTLMNIGAAIPRGHQEGPSLPILLLVVFFWPVFAFLSNMISPLPTPDKRP